MGTRHITIQDLVFVGSGIKEGHQNSGLDIVDSQNVTLLRLDAQGYTKSGIGLFNTNYWSVTYCNAFNNGFAGISVSNKDWKDQLKWNRNGYIAFTNTYNNSGDPNIRNNHSGNGIVIGQMIDLVIEYCRSYDNGWNMAWTGNGPVGIWTWCVDNALIQYCIAHDNKTRGKDGGGFDFDGGTTNSVIQYCLSYDNEGVGYGMFQFGGSPAWYNNTVRHCISINDGIKNSQAGAAIWMAENYKGHFEGLRMINNTFVNEMDAAVDFYSVIGDTLIADNIFVYKKMPFKGKRAFHPYHTIENNHYYDLESGNFQNEYKTIQAWAKTTGKEWSQGQLLATTGDPRLKNLLKAAAFTDPKQLESLRYLGLPENSVIPHQL